MLPLCLILYFQKEKEEKADIVEIAEDAPAAERPAPAPAPTLEIVQEQPHTPGTRKSTCKNFGRPASAYSDFYIWTLSQPGSVDTQYNVLTLRKLVNKLFRLSRTMDTYI